MVRTTLLSAALLAAVSVQGAPPATRVPVLVELFTSEGCSSCPAADALLATLQRDQPIDRAQVVPIGLHVDYFDHEGWKDPFSSPAFTERQRNYSQLFGPDSVYTPQIVVNGTQAIEGNDGERVRRAILAAAGRTHWPIGLTARVSGARVRMTVELPAAPQGAERIQTLWAITQDGLTTEVKRGENGGRTLHHVAVARRLQVLGPLGRQAAVVERETSMDRRWGALGLNAVVWLQGVKTRQVYGAATTRIVP